MNRSSSCLAAKAIKILQHVSNANELVEYFFQNKCYFTEVHLTLMQLNLLRYRYRHPLLEKPSYM